MPAAAARVVRWRELPSIRDFLRRRRVRRGLCYLARRIAEAGGRCYDIARERGRVARNSAAGRCAGACGQRRLRRP